ncbi:hypothetical protein [Polyangium mundeleinium]|uniref:Uncharacterized protein n=1 Tax=Polyangium mundeleinium TaxID=2995306 RepID=A0ABT5EM89_9BACT|nr:hypothetical protein [Polyangium mundeleinium]MDC0742958.1 hypothetical protein [Polyangium mundeleinium]
MLLWKPELLVLAELLGLQTINAEAPKRGLHRSEHRFPPRPRT